MNSDRPKDKSSLTPEQILAEANLSTTQPTSYKKIWIMLAIIVFLAIASSIALSMIDAKLK